MCSQYGERMGDQPTAKVKKKCPACGAVNMVSTALVGSRIRCGKCQTILEFDASTNELTPEPIVAELIEPENVSGPVSRRGNTKLKWLFGIATVVGFFIAVAADVAYENHDDSTAKENLQILGCCIIVLGLIAFGVFGEGISVKESVTTILNSNDD